MGGRVGKRKKEKESDERSKVKVHVCPGQRSREDQITDMKDAGAEGDQQIKVEAERY